VLTFVVEPAKGAPAAAAKKPIGGDKPAPANVTPALIKGFKWRDNPEPGRTRHRGEIPDRRHAGQRGQAGAAAGVAPLTTDAVIATPHYRSIDAYFNRGILSTQALAKMTAARPRPGPASPPSRPPSPTPRARCAPCWPAKLEAAVQSLLEQREKEGGDCYCRALQLTDDTLIKRLEAAKDSCTSCSPTTPARQEELRRRQQSRAPAPGRLRRRARLALPCPTGAR